MRPSRTSPSSPTCTSCRSKRREAARAFREYHPGDPLRTLDWRLTARHPRRFFTREFEQEEIAEIGLILDARRNTELRIGEESLFEYGVQATASLAEMFLHQGHRVSLLAFGENMLTAFPGYGKRQLHRIMSCLSKAKVATENSALGRLDLLPIRIFPPHALMIVISSLAATDRSFFQRLRALIRERRWRPATHHDPHVRPHNVPDLDGAVHRLVHRVAPSQLMTACGATVSTPGKRRRASMSAFSNLG